MKLDLTRKHKKIIYPLFILSLILFPLILLTQGSFSFILSRPTQDFNQVFEQADISSNAKAIEIKMLGAHDAFTSKITKYSPIDPGEDNDLLKNPLIKTLAGGFFVRILKTQNQNAKQLLKAGVRYFDIRLSHYNGHWYTKHGLISDKFDFYLSDLLTFLKHHPSEFLILDFQHIYFGESNWNNLLTYLTEFKVDGQNLFNYLAYNPSSVLLKDLTYGMMTNNQSKGGLILLANYDEVVYPSLKNAFYLRGDGEEGAISIRSKWHNLANHPQFVDKINQETDFLLLNPTYQDMLRVNQAQRTVDIPGEGTVDSLLGWSLLNMANYTNGKHIQNEHLNDWLREMPIMMVDYSNSMKNDFNLLINQKMILFNSQVGR